MLLKCWLVFYLAIKRKLQKQKKFQICLEILLYFSDLTFTSFNPAQSFQQQHLIKYECALTSLKKGDSGTIGRAI